MAVDRIIEELGKDVKTYRCEDCCSVEVIRKIASIKGKAAILGIDAINCLIESGIMREVFRNSIQTRESEIEACSRELLRLRCGIVLKDIEMAEAIADTGRLSIERMTSDTDKIAIILPMFPRVRLDIECTSEEVESMELMNSKASNCHVTYNIRTNDVTISNRFTVALLARLLISTIAVMKGHKEGEFIERAYERVRSEFSESVSSDIMYLIQTNGNDGDGLVEAARVSNKLNRIRAKKGL